MKWRPVMRLSDGTRIEICVPSPDDTDQHWVDGYRVRGPAGITEFSTLADVVDHLVELGARGAAADSDPDQPASTVMTGWADLEKPLRSSDGVHDGGAAGLEDGRAGPHRPHMPLPELD